MNKLGVEILYEHEATLELVKELKPDAVVLAAGSTMPLPKIPGIHKPFAATAIDLLSGKYQAGKESWLPGERPWGAKWRPIWPL